MYQKTRLLSGEVSQTEVVQAGVTIPLGSRLWPEYEAWLAAGNTPTEPGPLPAYVPTSVKMWQAKAALAAVDKLDAATAAINFGGTVPLKLAWEYATDLSRSSAAVASIGAVLGMSSADIDALFVAAEQIVV